MSRGKWTLLAIYAVLIGLALFQSGSAIGVWSLRLLLLLAVVHAIEVAVFFSKCREAPGSLPKHLLHIFLFGIYHAKEIDAAQSAR